MSPYRQSDLKFHMISGCYDVEFFLRWPTFQRIPYFMATLKSVPFLLSFFFVFARGFKGKSLIVKEGNYISSSNRFLWMRTHRHEIKFLYYMYVSVKCLVYSWRIRRIYAYTSIMMQIKRDIHRKICLHFISLHILECARLSSVFRSNN